MKLYIPVGIPGCGKSTLAERLFPLAKIHSTDAIREEIAGDVNAQNRNQDVFATFHQRITNDLDDGHDVFADATNLRDFARKALREAATFAETHVLVFTNLKEAVARNAKRERVVPADVMVRMMEQYEQACRDIPNEGYMSITYIEGLS